MQQVKGVSKEMEPIDLQRQDLDTPNIEKPNTNNRGSFVRGWNEFLRGERPASVDAKDDRWRREGYRAGEAFSEVMPEPTEAFMQVVFLWSVNQRRRALNMERLERLLNE